MSRAETEDYRAGLTVAVDAEVERLLAAGEPPATTGHRGLMSMIKTVVVAFGEPFSRWYADPTALAVLPSTTAALSAQQRPDGLFDSGGNLASPPDTAFTVNDGAITWLLLERLPTLDALRQQLGSLLERTRPGLLAGGVHTPNHRFELAAALVRLDAVRPDPALRERAEQWLAEGVDQDADGLYSERSPNYAAHVTNPSLLALAAHLSRPELAGCAHRSLHAQAVLTDADGRVETIHSRRQDQGLSFDAAVFGVGYRRFAVADGCPVCARAAEALPLPTEAAAAVDALAEVQVEPWLAGPLPAVGSEPPPTPDGPHEHRFTASGLVLLRHPRSETTVYGGSDVPAAGRVASGLACDPTFLRWRAGAAVLTVRLSRTYFGLGPFRGGPPEPLPAEQAGARRYRLTERLDTGFYQPLAAADRDQDGAYPLEFEGRYASRLAFSRRERTPVPLETSLLVTATDGALDLTANFAGADTAFALELTFRPGGELSAAQALPEPDCFVLVSGHGSYRVGADVITFGPGGGHAPDRPARYHPGEAYSFLGGTDATTGPRVYLTGRTVGSVTWTFRAGG